jgi:hypothetical protein
MHQLAYARAGTEDIDIDFAADEEDQDESSNTGDCVETCN